MSQEDEETCADDESRNSSLARKALFRAVEEREDSEASYSCKPLLNLFEPPTRDSLIPGHSAKQHHALMVETIQCFSKNHARRFFSALKSVAEVILSEEAYVPESAFCDEDDDEQDDSADIQPDPKSTEALNFLKYAAVCVEAILEGRKQHAKEKQKYATSSQQQQLHIPAQVYDVAVDLHNILFSLQSCGPDAISAQNTILTMCESWWHANASHRENLIVQCLPLLTLQALDGGKEFVQSHFKRLFQLRDAFFYIDFTNPSSDSLRALLLRVASNPLCLKLPEGKRFLAALFQDPILVSDLHSAIRAQIPDARKTVLLAYGEIYTKAWKDATTSAEEVRDALEHQALQDLMHAVIHVASPTTHKSILTMLEPLHEAKKSTEVATLLYRLYSPILWRSLGASNPLVRVHAIHVLAQVFPLQDPSQSNQMQQSISKATTALEAALTDSDPRVRVAASEATAQIAALFWEALPAADIRMLLNHVVLEHASDSSSSAVRAGALDATTTLLEIPQSHAVLRALLPSLGNLIHDKVEKVRVSCVRMLQKIKSVPGIRFYHVVPVDHLTTRLSEEDRIHSSPRNAVAKEISALMLNSYFPQGPNVSGADQLKRTLTFLMTEPAAAAVFYANLADFLPVDSVTKFITILLMCLRSAVQTDQAYQVRKSAPGKKRRRRGGAEEEEDQAPESQEQKMSAANTPLMASLADTISVLWESIESKLKDAENEPSHDLLLESFMSADCVSILSHFEQKTADIEGNSDEDAIARDDCFRTCAAILRCASRLPRDTIDELVPHISSTLSSISNDDMDYSRQHISAHFALLCLWGMTDEVASSLSSSIEAAFGDDMNLASSIFDDDSAKKTRRSSRRSSIEQPLVPIMSTRLVWGVIENILQGSDPSSVTTRESILASPTACNAIETALEHGTSYAERILQSDGLGQSFRESEVEFVLSACEAYGRFALHKEAQTGDGVSLSSQAKTLLNWTTEKLVPVFKKAQPGEMELRDLDLSRISNASDSLIIPGSPALMSPPRRKADLKNTPNRMEDDSAMFDSDGTLKEPTIFLVSAVAGALLQSSCVIFSEWLAVGGSGADEISMAAVKWCRVFQSEDEEEDPNEHHHTELMPAFVRLAVQLCKSSDDPLLLKQLLVNCSEETVNDDAAVMKKAILSLCTARSNQQSKVQGSVIQAFLGAAHELLDTVAVDAPFDLPDAVDEVWSHDSGCVASCLSVIMCNRQASSTLARQLVSNLSSHVGEPTKKSTFEAKCLSFLLTSNAYDAEIAKIIRDLDAGKFEEGGEMRNVVDKLLESAV